MPEKIFKAFIASADDCIELRKASLEVIEEINTTWGETIHATIDVYAWEKKKRAGYIQEGKTYQDEVFSEFGNHFDIFIILFWTKLGEGTKKEFYKFKTFFADNPECLFLGCHYGKPIPHNIIKKHRTYYDLIDFLKKEDKSWAPLGRERECIKDKRQFSKELRAEIHNFVVKKTKAFKK